MAFIIRKQERQCDNMHKFISPAQIFKVIKIHACVSCMIFLLGTLVFGALTANTVGRTVFSVIAMFFYFIAIYTTSLEIAQNDKKNYTKEKPHILKGLFLPVGYILTSILIYVIYFITWKYMTIDNIIIGTSGIINNMIFVIWNYVYSGFISFSNGVMSPMSYLITAIFPIIASFLGYLAGMKNFDITEKLNKAVYEDKED